MRNLTGYFLEESKAGGLMRKPSTLVLSAAVNQKDSIFGKSSWESRASLRWVICFSRGILWSPASRYFSDSSRVGSTRKEDGTRVISPGCSTVMRVAITSPTLDKG